MREGGPRVEALGSSVVLRALVAVEQPLPVDLLTEINGDEGDDLPTLLSRLELAGAIEWLDDGSIIATDDAAATTRLTGSERAALRGRVGHAARSSSLPPALVATWMLDGCRVAPDPAVVPSLLERSDRLLRSGDLVSAAAILERVVAAIERGQHAEPVDRVRAYLQLGYALRWLKRWDEASELATRALGLARESGDATALAIAAIAWRPDGISVSDDPNGVALVDEALAALGSGDLVLRSRLLAARSEALLFADLDAARAAADAALDLGRRAGDAETFLVAAYAERLAYWHPSRQAAALAAGTEMVGVSPRAVGHAEYGALVRLQVFLELGDWAHLDGELAAMARRVREAPRPFEQLWLNVMQAARAQTRGDWAVADELIDESLSVVSGPEYGSAFQLLLTQRVLGAWHAGEDLLGLVGADLLPAGPMRTSWEACLLGWTCERRAREDVEAALDEFLCDGIASVRADLTFGPVASSLAMAAAEIGSIRHAAVLLEALLPYADQWAGTGGAVVNGPFALHAARLAQVLGRDDDAVALFDRAARSATAGGCRPWLARIRLAQAQSATDTVVRRAHAQEAVALADELGMRSIAAVARPLIGGRTLPAGLTEREAEVLRLLADGATNAEIAERVFLSIKTVERHLLNAYRKAGVRNRAEATVFALRELC